MRQLNLDLRMISIGESGLSCGLPPRIDELCQIAQTQADAALFHVRYRAHRGRCCLAAMSQ
jgi:hypothetical protein